MKRGRQEATIVGCEAKLGSKRETDETSAPKRQEKNGGQKGTMDCTVRTGCKATMKAGVVEPYGQVCRKKTREVVERTKTCYLQSQNGGQRRWIVGAEVSRKR